MTSDKELIEQLAKEHLRIGNVYECRGVIEFEESDYGNYIELSYERLEAFAKAYAQTQGQKLIKTVYECTNCGYWYIGHTVSQCDCMPDKQEFLTMEVFTYEQTAAPIESGVKNG